MSGVASNGVDYDHTHFCTRWLEAVIRVDDRCVDDRLDVVMESYETYDTVVHY